MVGAFCFALPGFAATRRDCFEAASRKQMRRRRIGALAGRPTHPAFRGGPDGRRFRIFRQARDDEVINSLVIIGHQFSLFCEHRVSITPTTNIADRQGYAVDE